MPKLGQERRLLQIPFDATFSAVTGKNSVMATKSSDQPEGQSTRPPRALKARNGPLLVGALLADLVVFVLISSGDKLATGWQEFLTVRLLAACVAPVVVMLGVSLLPASYKARLVFWRWKHALPGHRAFSDRMLGDPRIDRDRLLRHVGLFPEEPGEQNRFWYRLFKKVEKEPSIEHVNQHFLLLRDLAVLSLLLIGVVLAALFLKFCTPTQAGIAVAIFSVQYLLAAISASRAGHGLVSSVLALHGVKRYV
jgi:hypothetical protein